jgi:sarcosine oxidase subunit gamma
MTHARSDSSSSTRCSPVHDALEHLHPEWSLIHGMPAAINFRESSAEPRSLALCDVSSIPRLGLKGPGAADWLIGQGLKVPSSIYGCTPVGKTGWVARAGTTEFLIEDSLGEDVVAKLLAAPVTSSVYRMQRQDASLLLSGTNGHLVLAETCGVDFSDPDSKLIYSRVAGVSCAILSRRLNDIPLWQFWFDNSYGMYLWETLLEIVGDHGGAAAGLSSFYSVTTAPIG